MDNFKQDFLIDEGIIFLNHGSFGACPKPVFEIYQDWQMQLERQPVRFLARQATDLLAESRAALAKFLNTHAENLVYTPNPTTAINMVVRSLELGPGDQVLTSDHEYGAMDRTWRYICGINGAEYVRHPVPTPLTTSEHFVEHFLKGITPRTRVIFLSHITSQTALTFPVKEICNQARQMGILSIIDGAHVPGQIPLDLQDIGADIYTGACHKWLCAPKGSAFLFARPDIQPQLDPLVVSWGYEAEKPGDSQFIDYHEWQGTRDLAAYLSVPRAIQYQEANHWQTVQQDCRELCLKAYKAMNALTGQEPLSPSAPGWFQQMVSVRLPGYMDPDSLKYYLYEGHQIEVPVFRWQDWPLMRVSFQAYNQESDLDALLAALEEYISKEKSS